MTESKIQWEGWGQFNGLSDFLSFVRFNEKDPFKTTDLLWVTTECPIVIWLN